ncbi:MAG: FG-GAP-like repeat-containing protein [Planctomycetota bacterium]
MRRLLRCCVIALSVSAAGTSADAQVQFSNVTTQKGLGSFTSSPGDGHAPGAVFTDLNGDGYADIYMMRAFNQTNGLFLNTPSGGSRTFVRAANDAGLGDRGSSNGAIAGDYDNDGDLDMFVINWNQPNKLYRNQLAETGTFAYVDATAATDPTASNTDLQQGVASATHNGESLDYSLTAAWADPDRDGDLDLFVGNHHHFHNASALQPGELPGQRDIYYENNGNGTFTERTLAVGLAGFETSSGASGTSFQNFSSTNAVIFADFNNDQWPDLMVTNKVGGPTDRDMLYINQGQNAAGEWLGYETATYTMPTQPFGHRSGGAMGVDVADIDHDGDLDFYITDWSDPLSFPNGGSNDLWINQLSETGTLNFLHSSELPALYSWGTRIADFDNNGYEDVHVATESGTADFLYLNSEQGFSADIAADAGLVSTGHSRGSVTADFDRDGLADLLVIKPWSGNSELFENRSDQVGATGSFLSIKLEGNPDLPGQFRSTRDAIGARVYVAADLDGNGTVEDDERLIREVVSGSSNAASTSSMELEFGLGLASEAAVEILWPSGRKTMLNVAADQFMEVTELLGDVDENGVVNEADMIAWVTGFGMTSGASAVDGDTDLDGDVDGRDFLYLQRGMGQANSFVAAGQAVVAVPEPTSAVLLAVLVVVAATGRRTAT